MNQHELVLYQYQTCPFCYRVLSFMQANGVEIPLKDTMRDPDARQELIELGGMGQVPALSIDGKILYESDEIIDWISANLLN